METYSLRLYQQQVLDQCINKSTIAVLPTGSGKTLIASYLIKNQILQKKLRQNNSSSTDNTIIVFIAPTKVLLTQQIEYLQKTNNTSSLVNIKIAEVNGESKFNGKIVEKWGRDELNEYLKDFDVLGMTPEILRRLLEQSLLNTDLLDCLIFDECHHILGKNGPMGKTCDALYERCQNKRPLVLGITASPTQSKKGTFEGNIKELENRMGGEVFVPNRETIECLKTHVNRPVFYTAIYGSGDPFQDVFMASSITRLQHAMHVRYFYQYQRTLRQKISDSESLMCIGIPTNSVEYVSQWLTHCLPKNSFNNDTLRQSTIRAAVDMSHNMICYVQETISQCGRVAKECGCYCAFTALLTLLPEYIDYAHWTGFHMATMSKVDAVKFEASIKEVRDGPFLHPAPIGDGMTMLDLSNRRPSRAPEIFSTHLALVLSLFEFFLSLYLAIPLQVRVDIVSRKVLQSSDGSKSVFYSLVEWLDESKTSDTEDGYPTVQYLYGGAIMLRSSMLQVPPFVFEGNQVVNIVHYLESLSSICNSIKAALPLTELLQYTVNSISLETNCQVYKRLLGLEPFNGTSMPPMLVDISGSDKVMDGLFSQKLVALIQTWCYFWWQNGRNPNMSAIIFCEMKLTVRTIDALFNDLHAHNEMRSDSVTTTATTTTATTTTAAQMMTTPQKVRSTAAMTIAMRSSALFGDNSQTEQSNILSRIKQDEINILIATNIAEEGLDIKSCQVVINFDHPQTAKSFIQRMGRARATSASMISLIARGDMKIVGDLKKFTEEAKRFDDETGALWDQLRNLKDMAEGSGMQDDSIEEDAGTAISREVTTFTVPATGATVDVISAKAIVHQYCQGLATDSFYSVTPIFAVEELVSDNKPPIPSFRCSLLMPKQVPNRARCAISPICSRKAAAVGQAALEMVKKLHECGELNDHLVVLKGEIALLEMAKSSKRDAVVSVKVKTYPDTFLGPSVDPSSIERPWTQKVLHVYAVDGEGSHFKSQNLESIAGCNDLQIGFEVLSNMGIALTQELSADLLQETFILNFGKSAWKEYRFKYMGTVDVQDYAEYKKLLLFHRSAYQRELMLSSFQDIIVINSSEDFHAVTQQLQADCNTYMESHAQDTISSSMLIIPLPPSGSDSDKASIPYCSCVEKCAFETQILLHNIKVVRMSQVGAGTKVILSEINTRWNDPASLSSPRQVYDEYQGLIMRSVNNTIVRVVMKPLDETVHLNSVTSFGKKGQPTATTPSRVVPVDLPMRMSLSAEVCEGEIERQEEIVIPDPDATTYAQYFMGKYPLALQCVISKLCQLNEAAPLLTVYALPRDYKPRDLLSNQGMALKKEVNHVLPHSCIPLGRARWHYVPIFCTSVVTRLTSLQLAEEARACVLTLMPVDCNSPIATSAKADHMIGTGISSSSSSSSAIEYRLPTVNEILQAITPRAAEESINSERLEMLGDSFLKFICSQELFHRHPSRHQGFLTAARAKTVSNVNLHEAMAKNPVSQYLRVETLTIAMKAEEVKRKGERNDDRFAIANVQYKLLADMAEALTAVYYLAGGVSLGKRFLTSIGVNLSFALEEEKVPADNLTTEKAMECDDIDDALIIPPGFDEKLKELLSSSSSSSSSSDRSRGRSSGGTNLVIATPTVRFHHKRFSQHMNESSLAALYAQLGYRFNDVGLLMEALTHASMQNCRSNERFEFYGDAILDFCIVSMLYKGNPCLQQGGLSQYKSRITCNKTLAQVAVRLGLHKYLLHCSLPLEDLLEKISILVLAMDSSSSASGNIGDNGSNDDDDEDDESNKKQHVHKKVRRMEVELPSDVKFLADAFEAIIAAIYIDSGSSLDTVCAVIRHIKMIPNEYVLFQV